MLSNGDKLGERRTKSKLATMSIEGMTDLSTEDETISAPGAGTHS